MYRGYVSFQAGADYLYLLVKNHTDDLGYRLIIHGFTSRSRIFHLYGDVTITGEGLQNLGLCSALRAFEQRGIFILISFQEVE
jgi:hypothetical protein